MSSLAENLSFDEILPDLAGRIGHYTVEPEDNFFTSIVVDLTHRCNMRCANCFIPRRDIPDMDVNKLYEVLSHLPKRTYIRLIGAEPTMRDDLPEIIRNIISLGHRPSLTTNGLKLAQYDYCESLKEAGLKLACISMNGADDDEVYKVLDKGKYARLKMRALTNALKMGFLVNTGTIIAKDVNEHIIRRQIEVVVKCAKDAGIDFCVDTPWKRVPFLIRIKTIGKMGRYMGDGFSGLRDLAGLVANQLDLNVDYIMNQHIESGLNFVRKTNKQTTSVLFPYETEIGPVVIRLIDWTVDDNGISDPGNRNRGRITRDWKIAPFFEDVLLTE